jgi:uncharacterized membrane protein YhaH (DUF805 family)
MAENVTMLEVREARGRFGRISKTLFWAFQAVTLLLMLGTCVVVPQYLENADPQVAMGAGLFGALALSGLWAFWLLGSLVLGVLALVTRGAKRLIPAPLPMRRAGSVPDTSWPPPPR